MPQISLRMSSERRDEAIYHVYTHSQGYVTVAASAISGLNSRLQSKDQVATIPILQCIYLMTSRHVRMPHVEITT
jgi:hypothetical protein